MAAACETALPPPELALRNDDRTEDSPLPASAPPPAAEAAPAAVAVAAAAAAAAPSPTARPPPSIADARKARARPAFSLTPVAPAAAPTTAAAPGAGAGPLPRPAEPGDSSDAAGVAMSPASALSGSPKAVIGSGSIRAESFASFSDAGADAPTQPAAAFPVAKPPPATTTATTTTATATTASTASKHPPSNHSGSSGAAPRAPGSSSSRKAFTLSYLAELGRGACGKISVVQWHDAGGSPPHGPSDSDGSPAGGGVASGAGATHASRPEYRVVKEIREAGNETKVRREYEQLKRNCNHPNVVKYHYFCHKEGDKGTVQVFMELMNLGSLRTVAKQCDDALAPTPERRVEFAQLVGFQLFMGLSFFHGYYENGMHRDVKPENLLLNTGGRVKLCDFDMSVSNVMACETMVGTASYAAPEVIVAAPGKTYTQKIDVWSAGVVLFELAAGYRPYARDGHMSSLCQSLGDLASVVQWPRDPPFPAEFEALLRACLTTAPEQRCSAADALAHPAFAPLRDRRRRDRDLEDRLGRKFHVDLGGNATAVAASWAAAARKLQERQASGDPHAAAGQKDLSNAMKRFMYNWEEAAVTGLEELLKAARVTPVFDAKTVEARAAAAAVPKSAPTFGRAPPHAAGNANGGGGNGAVGGAGGATAFSAVARSPAGVAGGGNAQSRTGV